MLLAASAVQLAIVGDVNHQLCCFLCLRPFVQHDEALAGIHAGALHLWTACECSHATWLTTIESFSPSILQQQVCCPAVTSTAWRATKQAK